MPIKASDRGQAARRRQYSLSLVRIVIQQAVRGMNEFSGCWLAVAKNGSVLLIYFQSNEAEILTSHDSPVCI